MTPYYETAYGQLYHGNCYEILPQLDLQADILLTDPMTGQGANTNGKRTQRGSHVLKGTLVENRDWAIMPDDVPFDPTPWLSYKQVILWEANHFSDLLPKNPKWIIWDKRDGSASDDNADCEMAWTNLPGVTRIWRQKWRGVCRAGEENIAISGPKLHPFQKPVALFKFCLEQCDLTGDPVVLDPFAGSGTTPVVCERMGIRWVAIELLEHFCYAIKNRLEIIQYEMW
jgi:site-specific DNA-methyltransferase (adenine-specific)